MEQSSGKKRCVNLDWLEVHCHEPQIEPRDPCYYMARGYNVVVREYGTRVYRQMFTLLDNFDEPLLEIRREPASQGLRGIHDSNECHIRLVNRTCYFDNAAIFLKNFLSEHLYYDVRISRVDICLDFVAFDKGDDPGSFIRRYFKHRYAKINQGRLCSHGEDTWNGQDWNSLSWGSKTSAVTTKMYDKTLELYDPKTDTFKKPYIREAWFHAGLIDNIQRVTLNDQKVRVWRVEFSLRSADKNWCRIELNGKSKAYQSIPNILDVYAGRDKLLFMFACLARHYFRFKVFEEGQRKDRCQDKILFEFGLNEVVYKLGKNDHALGSGQTFKAKFNKLITKLQAFQMSHTGAELHKACEILISTLTEEGIRQDLANPWDRDELETLKLLLKVRTADKSLSYDAAMEEVRKLLNISKKTLPPLT